ncbi:VPLPA-CTERM-specific exosortase XrtD [Lichenifustis flavocetrariae]|uniref:VPLPA-CTERM-specific exosortase XrtD n=1 Tax=Lichenifustis flavocetrariae TaxID=2949735 RepID=A0AA41YXK9_9HYPH|nr:VPLPA-CTERM-specific exosortase XrtD [Lichenifustis flavocetrariae]MCW6509052.1 VPLPA-CTERM-specific exosortase XrtD [Lichenifustis flavocetrariae]
MTNATQSYAIRTMQEHRLGLAFGVLVLGCTIATVLPGLSYISTLWGTEEYSHVYLIPPLALLTFLFRFGRAERGGARWPGIVLACFSCFVMFLGSVAGLYTVSVYGGLIGIYGLAWSGVGARGIRTLGGPILYLGFLVPLPKAFYLTLSSQMQLLSSKLGVAAMSAMGVTVFLDGNVIDLGSSKLEVAAACNGLRYLFPLLGFGYLMAMLLEDAFWKKVVLVISTLPIAVAMNAGRIAMIGVLVDRYGIAMAEGTQHEVEGFLVFFICILVLLAEVWVLLRIGKRGRFLALDMLVPDMNSLRSLSGWPVTKSFLIAGVVLVAGELAVAAMPTRAEVIPDRQPLSLFPMQFGDWSGTPHVMETQFLDMLHLTDYVLADYARPNSDAAVNFYVAYYESQKFGIQSHSPQQCIPGGGWNILSQSLIQIPESDGKAIPANRVLIERQGVRQVAYFWFDERGRTMTNDFELRYYAVRDAMLEGRSDGALIRLVTPVVDGDEAKADARLVEFVGAVKGSLGKYVPN